MTDKVKSTLELHFYALYDTRLQEYTSPFVASEQQVLEEMKQIVNDVKSNYYKKETYFILYDLGTYNKSNGTVSNLNPIEICHLDSLIDENIRNIQICIQTLNFLPQGYFKAPKEFQERIQDEIDKQIKVYTEKFIKPSIKECTNEVSV